MQQPRERPIFCGSWFEDPETWRQTYDRVAALNHWDTEEKLRRVYFYLEDVARTWFENRESALHTFDLFRCVFLDTFRSIAHKERAVTVLKTRVQLPNENVTIFVEEMTRRFHHSDPDVL